MQEVRRDESQTEAWRPILTGSAADAAMDAIEAIARALSYPRNNIWLWGPEKEVPHSLGYGNAGIALFFWYLGRMQHSHRHAQTALSFLEEVVGALEHETMSCSFFQGIAGICWLIAHLSGTRVIRYDTILAEQEQRLLAWCTETAVRCDLNNGISGVCLYASERMCQPITSCLCAAAINALSGRAHCSSNGLSWSVPPEIATFLANRVPVNEAHLYSTCVGYGSAGIVGGLLAAWDEMECRPRSEQLLKSAMHWLLATQSPGGLQGVFPIIPGLDLSSLPFPEGWYFGELGVALVLFNAGRLLRRDDWIDTAREAARANVRRRASLAKNVEHDFSLLCGSAGRAHIYNRLFQATGDEVFAEEARYWYSQTLACRRPGIGTCGFLKEEIDFQSFLSGSAGVGLALIAAVSAVEPFWDRALLASCRTGSEPEISEFDDVLSGMGRPNRTRIADSGAIEVIGDCISGREPMMGTPAALSSFPLVSCIMPTRNRKLFALQATRYFLYQDYPNRELIILDDGDDELGKEITSTDYVRYIRTPSGLTIGAKRNYGCELAAGAIIAQWDDDDWYGRSRLSDQVAPLRENVADITGLSDCVFMELEKWKFWTCSAAVFRRLFVGDVHGGTLVFRAELFHRGIRYPDESLAEDARFLYRSYRAGARLRRMPADGIFVYVRHPNCAWSFECGFHIDSSQWYTAPEPLLPMEDYRFLNDQHQMREVPGPC
jgi:hypothetical protein